MMDVLSAFSLASSRDSFIFLSVMLQLCWMRFGPQVRAGGPLEKSSRLFRVAASHFYLCVPALST